VLRIVVPLSAALSFVSSGCGAHTLQGRVASRAQQEYGCAAEDVRVLSVRRNTFDVHACGRRVVYQCHGYTQRCENLSRLAQRRALAELTCASTVTAVEVSPFVFMIRGCSQPVTYHCEMTGGIGRCARETPAQ